MAFGRGCLVGLGTSLTFGLCSRDCSPLPVCLRDQCQVTWHAVIVIALLLSSCIVHPCWLGGSSVAGSHCLAFWLWRGYRSALLCAASALLCCHSLAALLLPCASVGAFHYSTAPFHHNSSLVGCLQQAICTGTCSSGLRLSLADCLGACLSGTSPPLRLNMGSVCMPVGTMLVHKLLS
jgi:hypothetical protein